jgi:hypothetical protein
MVSLTAARVLAQLFAQPDSVFAETVVAVADLLQHPDLVSVSEATVVALFEQPLEVDDATALAFEQQPLLVSVVDATSVAVLLQPDSLAATVDALAQHPDFAATVVADLEQPEVVAATVVALFEQPDDSAATVLAFAFAQQPDFSVAETVVAAFSTAPQTHLSDWPQGQVLVSLFSATVVTLAVLALGHAESQATAADAVANMDNTRTLHKRFI